MDGVTVGEKSVLQGCIVGRRAVVGRECGLRECEVQEGFKVEDRVEEKGHKFMVFDGLEEGGAGDGEGEDGQEEDGQEEEGMVVDGTDED